MPDSGPNVESNIETPTEDIVEVIPVTTIFTTSYISRGARIRTGDLLLPKQARYRAAPRPVRELIPTFYIDYPMGQFLQTVPHVVGLPA